jgi:hypothetical protein
VILKYVSSSGDRGTHTQQNEEAIVSKHGNAYNLIIISCNFVNSLADDIIRAGIDLHSVVL